jgi:hypothetical protein
MGQPATKIAADAEQDGAAAVNQKANRLRKSRTGPEETLGRHMPAIAVQRWRVAPNRDSSLLLVAATGIAFQFSMATAIFA